MPENNLFKEFVKLVRVRQWHKNGFVLLGFFLVGDFRNYSLLYEALVMGIAFVFSSSTVYILNDYLDIEEDRNHPVKRQRPLASGTISKRFALSVFLIFFTASIIISLINGLFGFSLIIIYLLSNVVYSIGLKQIPIVDVFIVALGFMLRILAGTSAIGIHVSEWMLFAGLELSLFLGFSKRYSELAAYSDSTADRFVLQHYSLDILRTFMIIIASTFVMTYSLYTVSARSIELHGTTNLMYTIPIVIFGLFRYFYLILMKKGGEDPSAELLKDKQLLFTVIIWMVTYSMIIL